MILMPRRYNTLFQFLMRLKRVQLRLESAWQGLHSLSIHKGGRAVADADPAYRQRLRDVQHLRHHMSHLVSNLQIYIQLDVIESNHKQLGERMGGCCSGLLGLSKSPIGCFISSEDQGWEVDVLFAIHPFLSPTFPTPTLHRGPHQCCKRLCRGGACSRGLPACARQPVLPQHRDHHEGHRGRVHTSPGVKHLTHTFMPSCVVVTPENH